MSQENNKPLYMTAEEYLNLIHQAHSTHILSNPGFKGKENHIADLSIESTAFFESAFQVLDALATKFHNDSLVARARREEQKAAIEALIEGIHFTEPEPESEPKKKKKRGKK